MKNLIVSILLSMAALGPAFAGPAFGFASAGRGPAFSGSAIGGYVFTNPGPGGDDRDPAFRGPGPASAGRGPAFSRPGHSGASVTTDTATFATGCFWCTEATFKLIKGVVKVTAGFSGGHTVNPTYEQVCTGTTGHAETCNIIFDPKQVSFDELLAAFFTAHDPTQLNRQGNDVGTQYRSAIFYHNAAQKQKAEYYIKKLNDEKAYPRPIVTQVVPFTVFYKAEDYHQDYYNRNGDQPYCKYVIQPELEKFKKVFAGKLKTSNK